MTKKSREHKYTAPDLREEIKEDIKQSDKGGRQTVEHQVPAARPGVSGGVAATPARRMRSEEPREVDRGGLADSGGRDASPERRRDGSLPSEEAWKKMSDEEARDREKEARRLQAGRTVRRQYEGGAAGPQRVAGPADQRLRQPEHRRSGEEGEEAPPGRRPRTSAITRSGTGTARPSSSRWTAASSRQRSGSRGWLS